MKLQIVTNHPVAVDSYDHIKPHGTKQDNTSNNAFVQSVINKLGYVKYADIGCAGGWFARAFHTEGHLGVGVEGSDYSRIHKRAEWGVVPDILFTADITKPFHFVNEDNSVVKFNIMSAFDVLEHIHEHELPALMDNLKNNLETGGYFVCSVAIFEDRDEGGVYHVTLKPEEWWVELFKSHGFVRQEFLQRGEYGRSSSFDMTFINTNAA